VLAIIGGSGLYQIEGVQILKESYVETPFGSTTSPILWCALEGAKFLFLPRHNKDHSVPPSSINFKANVFALKQAGASTVLSVSAVGSLREELSPNKFCFATDFIDFTRLRDLSFFSDFVVHWSPVPLVCKEIVEQASKLLPENKLLKPKKAVYICIEGPRFSTKAESEMFRAWGADLIGMTACPECLLCREARICYANLCVITDYDCWKDHAVTQEEVMTNFKANLAQIQEFIKQFVVTFQPTCEQKIDLNSCFVGGVKPEWFEVLRR
jgi:5'-methylthioadenosine phosphorylase